MFRNLDKLKAGATAPAFFCFPEEENQSSRWVFSIRSWRSWASMLRVAMGRASFTSRQDLKHHIEQFIAYFNETMAKPFKWTMTGKPLTA